MAFGGKVWYRQVRDTKERTDQFESEWEEGVWLGRAMDSNGTSICTSAGVLRAYAIQRMGPGGRWDGEAIQALRGNPTAAGSEQTGVENTGEGDFRPNGGDRAEHGRRLEE